MNKAYNRTYWENKPSDVTPLNETNLNKIEVGIDEIDNRVITLDTTKFDKTEAAKLIKRITFDRVNGIFTITYYNGATATIDTMLEKLAVNFDYDPQTQQLVITLDDGTIKYIDMSALITQYEFNDTDTVAFSVDATGEVSAIVKEGSIEEKHLQPNYLADIKVEVAKAQSSERAAAQSAADADYNAKLAQSYAVGDSGMREGEDTDNAKYYKEQAANSASTASTKASEAAASAATATNKASAAATSAQNAKTSETNAKKSETNAATSANTATTKASVASTSATNAATSAESASTSATNAANSATEAESYAHGGTGTRENEAVDNAMYYYEQARGISEGLQGSLLPMGTVTFSQLETSTKQSGYMYNISDEFTTDDTFKEGAGYTYPAGTNVYYTADGYWDCLAGTMVTGVKGNAETSYRKGNVNITPKNIGALSEDGDSAENTVTFESGDAAEANVWTDVDVLVSGEKHKSILKKISTMFKNIRYLYKMLGNTDISDHGGTVTQAIVWLANDTYELEREIAAQNDALATVKDSLIKIDLTLDANFNSYYARVTADDLGVTSIKDYIWIVYPWQNWHYIPFIYSYDSRNLWLRAWELTAVNGSAVLYQEGVIPCTFWGVRK